MKEVLKRLAPGLRALGFQGSGQNYRKRDGDFVFVINFQGSRQGERFYINLGAQAVFIPTDRDADLSKLKEYECMLRRRVGDDWPWQMSDEIFMQLEAELRAAQAEFFGNAQTLRSAIALDDLEDLLRKFSTGTTEACAALHLARGAAKLGHVVLARKLVNRGMALAGDRADVFKARLGRVLDDLPRDVVSHDAATEEATKHHPPDPQAGASISSRPPDSDACSG